MTATGRVIRVVAGILLDAQGRVLLSCRRAGTHLAGGWEFPGGKIERHEDPAFALRRELKEEIGIDLLDAEPFQRLTHRYTDKTVDLEFWRVLDYAGIPRSLEQQKIAWVSLHELRYMDILPADWPIVNALALPQHYLITPQPTSDTDLFLARLEASLGQTVGLVQFRAPGLAQPRYRELLPEVTGLCRQAGKPLILHSHAGLVEQFDAAGVHLTSAQLMSLQERPLSRRHYVGASCHTAEEIEYAQSLGLDYITLGAVRQTPSHPESRDSLGLQGFAELAAQTSLPVYAIGGMRQSDIELVRKSGGHGIAAITHFWKSGPDRA